MSTLLKILFLVSIFGVLFFINSVIIYFTNNKILKNKKIKYIDALKIDIILCLIMGLYYIILLIFRINWHEVKSFKDILNSVYLLYY